MASKPALNGASSTTDGLTNAQRLAQDHAVNDLPAVESHKPTVEDAEDEDIAAHPLPSDTNVQSAGGESSAAPFGSKAAGKQPVRTAPDKKPAALDTTSEELFPALGAHKAAPAAVESKWYNKPAAVAKAANGISANGNAATTDAASRASTPMSGMMTPSNAVPSQRGPTHGVEIPGQYTEQVALHPADMLPRKDLKKPIPEILRDINKRSKATVQMKSGSSGAYIFEGKGPVDSVRMALKEIAGQLCAKRTEKVPVPTLLRGKIVGKQGAIIQAISKRTGARINISKQEAAEILEDDDDATVDVVIEGDPFAVQMAKQDIEKIVNEHTSSVNTRLKHIPAEYYPFLASTNNQALAGLQRSSGLRMQIPHYGTWSNQQVMPKVPSNRQPAVFAAQTGLPIQLSGERQAVADARVEIERQVQEFQRQLTMEQVSVERGRHQFIVGDRGTSIHDFLLDTGCTVILPPDGAEDETLTVIGPADRIDEATNKIIELGSSMASATADITRAHASAPRGAREHAQDIARYLQQQSTIQELERTHDAKIIPDSTGVWQIYARDGKNAIKARADVMNLISGHPPARFHPVSIDPFYHGHIRQQAASRIREQYGVRVVVPDDQQGDLLLVFEDRVPSGEYTLPRKVPSPQDAQTFQQSLQLAQQEILNIMNGRPEIVFRSVDAPVKHHDKVRRFVDRHHQTDTVDYIPVQVTYGAGPGTTPSKRATAPTVGLRGPQDNVDELFAKLTVFLEQEERDELERGFTLDFEFPQKFANHLIGRKGEHINKVRDEYDVDIQLNEGTCVIKGPEAKANACKKHILSLLKNLEDEKTHHLNIPAEFHKDLIGPQGSQVNRLQERYSVRVNFPRTAKHSDDTSSLAEGASRRDTQAPNEVIVRGPSKGADGCRDELLSLLQYARDNSHVATVSVAQNQVPSLIGAGGKEMEALRLETGAQIDVPNARDASGANGRVEIKVKGSKKAVEDAKKSIEEKAKIFDSTVTRNLEVDRKLHRFIIGPQGTNLRGIIVQAGGPEDTRLHNRMIRFPKTDAEGNTIRIEGQKSVIDKICAAIEKLVIDQESQTIEIVEVKPDKHRLLIGRGGEIRRQLEQQFGVAINIPRQSETGPQRSQVRVSGQPDKVELAKAHILEVTKELEGESINIPRRFHHIVADNGQFFRRLRNDHKVTVDHNGQRPPPKPAATVPSRANGSSMPLITDDPVGGPQNHSWEEHDLHSSAEEGEIPWILSGPSPEAIQAAKTKLDAALEEAKKQDTIGFLILPDPRAYRHVIGPGGSEINRIRKKTATKIQVPRDQNKGEAIEIQGSKGGVQEAKDIILEIVQKNA